MGQYPFGEWETESHEEGGPVDAVEPNNVLANDMAIGGPSPYLLATRSPWVSGLCDVVHQCVEPHVHGLRIILRDADPPAQALRRARYGQVF